MLLHVGSCLDPNESFRGVLLCFRCGITRNVDRNSLFFTLIYCFIDLTMITAQTSHRQHLGMESVKVTNDFASGVYIEFRFRFK
ncbi:hypothetical protein HanPSC8_Chr15g0679221 [Helianthus annuus]|nr:hypothetical protein HanPSC8_Chr15g0679221 [Helianthus annuus]